MKHYLFYLSNNKYERVPLSLSKHIMVGDDGTNQGSADDHENYYKSSFDCKECTAFHILVLHLDPANGITEVLRNEYFENPLKTRTIINAAAKSAAVVKKRSLLDQITMPSAQASFEEFITHD